MAFGRLAGCVDRIFVIAGAVYFQYYDYYFDPLTTDGQHCRFYLKPTMKLEAGDEMVVAEVRRTTRR